MENLILQKRKMVQDRIEKSFNSGLRISELQAVDINKSFDTDIEKAHNVGDIHPNGKWVWTEIRPGKFDWRVKKNSDNGSGGSTSTVNSGSGSGTGNAKPTPAPASKPTAQKKFDSDVVEHVDELVKKIGKDKALERFEKYVKEYGDDGTKFGAMMKYKYSQAAEYLKGKAESDFKKTFKDARDEVLQQIVSGKIQASADERKWTKDLLDERKAATTVPAKIDYTVDKEIYDRSKTNYSLGSVNKIEAEIKDLEKFIQRDEQKFNAAKDAGTRKFYQESLTANISRKKAAEDALAEKKAKSQNNSSLANVDSKQDKAAQDAGFKNYEEMKAWQDYGTAKQLLKKELTHRKQDKQKIADLKKEIATYEKNHADVIAAHNGGKSSGDNKTTQKSKSAGKTFADKIMERAKDGRWFGSLSDDEKKKLEDNIKNDKASINDLLLAKFPAAPAYSGFSSEEESKIQLANGKMLKLVHSASIQSNRMGQEYTKHDYQITDLYGKVVYGSSQSSQGYTTPAQAKRETIDQALYALFAKK